MEIKLKKVKDYVYEIEKQGDMKVPVFVYASEKILEDMKKDKSLQQGINVASSLPNIYEKHLMMPDAHQGYGFSIGGVAAIDAHKGCITPGGIGFDINCGVRLMSTNLTYDDIKDKIEKLLDVIFENVPSGVGSESKIELDEVDMDAVLREGAKWAVENGYGNKDDLINCESGGSLKEADPVKISPKAKKRGKKQLGTLGAGNHFLEIQLVDEIYDEHTANVFGIEKKNQVTVMIHCGSRGLGHQVCSDYIRKMEEEYPHIMEKLPEKDLIYAPSDSKLAKDYFKAMSAAANYAWTNRHIIGHFVRESFKQVFGDKVELKTVYDVAHNIAKKEIHEIDGEQKEVYLHRKGATRAFGPGNKELPKKYQEVGQPVIIPGSMGTASYLLAGTEAAMKETFGSTAHGAGRVMSRHAALKEFNGEEIKSDLAKRNIFVKCASKRGIAEEAPGVYKDIDEVIKVSDKSGIAKVVVKVIPFGVIKG